MRIGIVGCGPAGLATALLLSRGGHDVALFERFDEPHAVGSGFILQPTGLAVLSELGLSDQIHDWGQRLDRIYGVAEPSGRIVLNVNYAALGEGFHGLAVHRAALFDVLYGAVQQSGIEVITGCDVRAIEYSDAGDPAIDGADQHHKRFDLIVDASGARSVLRQYATRPRNERSLEYGAIWGTFEWPGEPFDMRMLEQRYVGAHTMIGVLPIGRHRGAERNLVAFFWSLKTAAHPVWLDAGLEVWKSEVRNIWPESDAILQQIRDPSQMALAIYGHSTLSRPYGSRMAFVGDAAHSTSPQLGQGANMALLDAWALSEALNVPGDIDEQLRRYAQSRRWHVRAFQWSSLAMTPFYQSDSRVLAALRDLLFDPVSKLPIARRIVAGLISGMLAGPPKGLDYRSGMRTQD
ncbi:MAG: NAD(P)/FAD-dependent oxidoreductase [Pseudomonadota bacterium]